MLPTKKVSYRCALTIVRIKMEQVKLFVRYFVKDGDKWSDELVSLAQLGELNQQSIFLHHKAIEKEVDIVRKHENNFASRSAAVFRRADFIASLYEKQTQRTAIRKEMDRLAVQEGLISQEKGLVLANQSSGKEENVKDLMRARTLSAKNIEADLEFYGGPLAKRSHFEPKYSRVVLKRLSRTN